MMEPVAWMTETSDWPGEPLVRLSDADARIKELEALLKEAGPIMRALLDFMERHSNRWDGVNGEHPAVTVEAARSIAAKIGGKDG